MQTERILPVGSKMFRVNLPVTGRLVFPTWEGPSLSFLWAKVFKRQTDRLEKVWQNKKPDCVGIQAVGKRKHKPAATRLNQIKLCFPQQITLWLTKH